MSEGRSVWRLVLNNILNSLRLFPSKGRLMGEDSLGNKYYESPQNKHSIRKSAPRWFEPKDGEWQQDLPAEWEAWLRGRRKDPPTKEEIQKNLSIANMKKEKGMESTKSKEMTFSDPSYSKSVKGFPNQEEYEREPGKYKD